jgi:Fe-S-cluster-containing dehydrogenase component
VVEKNPKNHKQSPKGTEKTGLFLSDPVTRREFLRNGTAGILSLVAAVAIGDLLDIITFPDGTKVALAKAAVLAEKAVCSGCRTCEAVCSHFNSDGRNTAALARVILDKDYMGAEYQPRVCFQCLDPPCLRACPVAALQVDKQSGTFARVIDERVCIGCKKCLEACDRYFALPRPRFDPEKKITVKCHLCFGDPQCVKHCPTGALWFERSEKGLRIGYPIIKGV